MIVIMQAGIPMDDPRVKAVLETAKTHGLRPVPRLYKGTDLTVVEIQLRNEKAKTSSLRESIFMLDGVDTVHRVNQRLKVSRVIQLEPFFTVGKNNPCALVVGPCTVDEHIFEIAGNLKKLGIQAMRGGCWKPRSSPYSFRGYGDKALRWILEAATKHEIEAVFTEVMLPEHIHIASAIKKEVGYKGTVVLWVGASTESDFLLDALGHQNEFPVMLKNNKRDKGIQSLIKNAERVHTGWTEGETPDVENGLLGNDRILFCLRGTERSGDASGYRNDPNHHWVRSLRDACDAPVVIDPSHSAGTMKNDLVLLNCKSALLHDPDLIMVEGGYPAKGFKDGFRGYCDVDQSIPLERLPEVITMVNEHNRQFRA